MTQSQTERYVLAVDIGTTSTKTLVIDAQGTVIASHSEEYPMYTPSPDMAEQDPDEIFQAVKKGIRAVTAQSQAAPSQFICVSFSAAMHSILAVNEQLEPLTRSVIFADNRSAPFVETLRNEYDAHRIYRSTGTPIHPMSPLLKLMWFKKHRPELFRSNVKFIGIKEYVLAKLFGKLVVDYSIASATGLFNLNELWWDQLALEAAGVNPSQLPEPVDTTYRLEGLSKETAEQLGLLPDTPFVVGASDGVLANLGIGAIDRGVYAVTIGTSGAVRGVVGKPSTDEKERLFCYALNKDFWVVGGAINNGGIMLRWVRDQLATLEAEYARKKGVDPYEELARIAESVKPGSDGLIFLPLLTGERAPYWNANARGVFFGLSLFHEKKHMIRAVMEGVMYRIHSVVTALEENSGPAKEIRASGGFARSAFWRQMMADVLSAPVKVPQSIESSGLGAAKLGLLAAGEVKQLQELDHWVNIVHQHEADEQNHRVYERLASIYMDVYHSLKKSFDDIAQFQKEY